jgi:hypothetical protein
MRHTYRFLYLLLLTAILASPLAITGCAARASYRVYDPYHSDYHRWDGHEVGYYQRWEVETHRDHHDFDKRDKDDQKQYWNWRHVHAENDRH